MPGGVYINTPATTAGDATYLTNGLGRLDELSPEKSFAAPSKNNDLITQLQKSRKNGVSLKTPRASQRDPLRLLPNGPVGRSEFTPLMKSVTKNNLRRASAKKFGVPDTPAFLKENYSMNGATPGLPTMVDDSQILPENTTSSAGEAMNEPPIPQNISSSVNSTPLAQLPGRDGRGGVLGDGNIMTLREQENIIDKIEKENFGLKMKIHFLEQAMAKRGPEFNQAALKENTELKVIKITMQKELHKFKKNIAQAEHDAEVYRLQLAEYRERVKKKQADESVRIEIEKMAKELKSKDADIQRLQDKLKSAEQKRGVELKKLRDEVGDLEAVVMEKDRIIEEKEDEIDSLKANVGKESDVAATLEEELETAKQHINELQEDLERAATEAKVAKQEREGAMEDKKQAEKDLDELREEMMNKSFTTKGLSRQLEDKAGKMEDQLQELQERHAQLQKEFDRKARDEKQLQERLQTLEREGASGKDRFQRDLENARHELENTKREVDKMHERMQSATNELNIKLEEKDLLQVRHDALTNESADLQKDFSKAQRHLDELEQALNEEREHAAQNDHVLRSQHKTETDMLMEQVDSLHHEISTNERQQALDQDSWAAEQRKLEAAAQRAEEKAKGLQRTVEKLQEAEGTLSGTEMKLREALESEKERHRQEEQLLGRQIDDLNNDLASKREASDNSRSELTNAKEELRISIREQASLKEMVEQLEEEVEVLQASLEEQEDIAVQNRHKNKDNMDAQLQKVKKEKQTLQDQLANANIKLHAAKTAAKEAEAERDELEAKQQKAERPAEDTFNVDHEKRELRRTKQKLEKDLDRVKIERDNLLEANAGLEGEINAEIERANADEHRLNTEIDLLKNKQLSSSELRDRELNSAKNKVQRLEVRIQELEELLDNQTKVIASPGAVADLSNLQHDLTEARKKETASVKRESDLKSNVRDLKAQIVHLEGELHEMHLAQLEMKTHAGSTPPSHSKELAKLRKDLLDTRSLLKDLRNENKDLEGAKRKASDDERRRADLSAQLEDLRNRNRDLENAMRTSEDVKAEHADLEAQLEDARAQLRHSRSAREARRAVVDETERADLHALLKSSTLEAEALALKLSERDGRLEQLSTQLQRLQDSRNREAENLTMKLSSQGNKLSEMKGQLIHLRGERSAATKKADAVMHELDSLQSRYEGFLEKVHNQKNVEDQKSDEMKDKYLHGLSSEVLWLRAKYERAEGFRADLMYIKVYFEKLEKLRVKCNETLLSKYREAGINVPREQFEIDLDPRQKFRSVIGAVRATIRMRMWARQWKGMKRMGAAIEKARAKTEALTGHKCTP